MINQKTYSFLIKFLIFAFAFLSISIIVQSFIFEDIEDEINYSIPYLKIDDSKVDSVLATMNLDEKIDLFIKTRANDSLVQDTNYQKLSLIRSSNYFPLKFIEQYNYFNGIADTSIISEYLKNIISCDSTKTLIYKLNDFDILSTSDSTFFKFYNHRFKFYKKLINSQNCLMGVKINPFQLSMMDSLKKDSSSSTYKLVKEFRKKLDIVLIDSFSVNQKAPDFQGVIIANQNDSNVKNFTELVHLINGVPDVLLVSQHHSESVKANAKTIILKKQHNEEKWNLKLRKLVKLRIWQEQNQTSDTITQESNNQLIEQQLVEASICLLNNQDSLLPLKNIYNQRFVIAWVGNHAKNEFPDYFKKYANSQLLYLKPNENNWQNKLKYLQNRAFIVYVLDTLLMDTSEQNQLLSLIENMNPEKSLFVNFGNYKNLSFVPDSFICLQTLGNSKNDYKFAAQAIFGGIACEGGLPFNITKGYSFGTKFTSTKKRLKYTIPEDAGLDPEKLEEIDKIAWQGISSGAFPGCQIFVAKEGKVVLNKSYGYHTYSRRYRVEEDDVYDLASVTKIAAATTAAMKMISDQKMSLNDKLGKFFKNTTIDYTRIQPDTVVQIDTFFTSSIQNWKEFLEQNDTLNINDTSFITRDTIITKLTPSRNIFKVPVFDLLRHKSGIVPAVPVFRYMYYKAYFIKQLKDELEAIHGKSGPMFDFKSFKLPDAFPDNTSLPDTLKLAIKKGFKTQYEKYFSKKFVKDTSDIQLTNALYFKNEYFDTIWRDIKQLPVFSRKVSQYSDINMVLLQMAIDSLNKKSIDEYLKKNVYKQLGLKTITYRPLKYYSKNKIIPTELDDSWRYGLLHGFVHDPSAALLGGMTGNAGLYSNAHDLGILFQMILNKGTYGGVQYLKPGVVEKFTKRFDDTQRALGFDIPNRKAVVGKNASKNTFGHSGYTGTCVWVDPDNQLVYIFLSNRNHPNGSNWKIVTHKIRERIHDAIYNAIIKDEDKKEKEKLIADKQVQ
jgi:CubicO group peptidase (beta-lactamase class C family)